MNPVCPLPANNSEDRVTLAHGEGGRLMRRMIREIILPKLGNGFLETLSDAACLPEVSGSLAFTTDSYVVSPLQFPGGDIGRLAVIGTVNDLAVSGAEPLWLTLSLIIEEGLPLPLLESIVTSVAAAARESRVLVVAGDTKVVPRDSVDGIFLNTSGVGRIVSPTFPGAKALQPGDELIVTGPVGRHGVAILAQRENLGFEPPPRTDCAALTDAVKALRTAGVPVKAARDATRGGLTAVLHEFAEACGHTLWIDERRMPSSEPVRGVCELLGLDPLHLACEGTMLVAVAPGAGAIAVEALRAVAVSSSAAWVGSVVPYRTTPVIIRRLLGTDHALDEPVGSPLPRIC